MQDISVVVFSTVRLSPIGPTVFVSIPLPDRHTFAVAEGNIRNFLINIQGYIRNIGIFEKIWIIPDVSVNKILLCTYLVVIAISNMRNTIITNL